MLSLILFVPSLCPFDLCCAATDLSPPKKLGQTSCSINFWFSPYQLLNDGFSTDSWQRCCTCFSDRCVLGFLGWLFFVNLRALIDVNLTAGNLELLVLSVNFSVSSVSSDNITAEVMFAFSPHYILIENQTNAFLSHFSTSMKSR